MRFFILVVVFTYGFCMRRYIWSKAAAKSGTAKKRFPSERHATDLRRKVAINLLAMHCAFALTAFFIVLCSGTRRLIWNDAMLVEIMSIVISVAGVWFMMLTGILKQSVWKKRVLIDFAVWGGIGLAVCTYFAVREINMDFDHAIASVQRPVVLRKSCDVTCEKMNKTGRHTSTLFTRRYTEEDCNDVQHVLQMTNHLPNCKQVTELEFHVTTAPLFPDTDMDLADRLKQYSQCPIGECRLSDPKKPMTIEISEDRWLAIKTSDSFDVPIYHGYFGWNWYRTDDTD
jgi:hypothetical protein